MKTSAEQGQIGIRFVSKELPVPGPRPAWGGLLWRHDQDRFPVDLEVESVEAKPGRMLAGEFDGGAGGGKDGGEKKRAGKPFSWNPFHIESCGKRHAIELWPHKNCHQEKFAEDQRFPLEWLYLQVFASGAGSGDPAYNFVCCGTRSDTVRTQSAATRFIPGKMSNLQPQAETCG